MVIGKVHLTDEYARYRVRNPDVFQRGSLRTKEIGTHGNKLIVGRPKGSKHTAVQAVLIRRENYERGQRVKVEGTPSSQRIRIKEM